MTPRAQLQSLVDELGVSCEITGGSHSEFVLTMETGEVERPATFEDAVETIREYHAAR